MHKVRSAVCTFASIRISSQDGASSVPWCHFKSFPRVVRTCWIQNRKIYIFVFKKELSPRIFLVLNSFSLNLNDSPKLFVRLWVIFHRVKEGLKRRKILLLPKRIVLMCQFFTFCQVLNYLIVETLIWSKPIGLYSSLSLDRDRVATWLNDSTHCYHFFRLDGDRDFVELDEFCSRRQDLFVRFEQRIR